MSRLLAAAALLLAGAAPAAAQEALDLRAPRILHQAETAVKSPDGPAVYRFTTTYDPAAGEYVYEVVDTASGAVLRREVSRTSMAAPMPEEQALAKEAIAADPEIAALIAAAEHPVRISGGFPLVREAGAPFCGPGSRCLQYDVFEVVPGQKEARRIRYVAVDLRTGALAARDMDPTWEGNFANPAMREASRARGLRFPTE